MAEENGTVFITIKPPSSDLATFENQKSLQLEAEIQWSRKEKEAYKYGFKFVNVSQNDKVLLKQIFEFFHSEPEFV